MLTVYEEGKYDSPVFVVGPATYQEAVLRKPHFRKEVTTDEVIVLSDNNSRFYRLSPENTTGSCNLKIHYSMYATVFNTIAPKKRFMRFRSDQTCLILFIIIIHLKVTLGRSRYLRPSAAGI